MYIYIYKRCSYMYLCVTSVCKHVDAVVILRVQMCVVVGLCMRLHACVCMRASGVWVSLLENAFFRACLSVCVFVLRT